MLGAVRRVPAPPCALERITSCNFFLFLGLTSCAFCWHSWKGRCRSGPRWRADGRRSTYGLRPSGDLFGRSASMPAHQLEMGSIQRPQPSTSSLCVKQSRSNKTDDQQCTPTISPRCCTIFQAPFAAKWNGKAALEQCISLVWSHVLPVSSRRSVEHNQPEHVKRQIEVVRS
jgi:hypothetical protein